MSSFTALMESMTFFEAGPVPDIPDDYDTISPSAVSFVVRNKVSKLFFVLSEFDHKRGQTLRELGNKRLRYYNTKQAAQRSIDCWLQGKWSSDTSYDYDVSITIIPQDDRNADEMEIIKVDFDNLKMEILQ